MPAKENGGLKQNYVAVTLCIYIFTPLTPHIMPCYTDKMAIVSWP